MSTVSFSEIVINRSYFFDLDISEGKRARFSVAVRHDDDAPDISHLGEELNARPMARRFGVGRYSQPDGFYIDMQSGKLHHSRTDARVYGEAIRAHGEKGVWSGFQHDASPRAWAHVSDSRVNAAWLRAKTRKSSGVLRASEFECRGIDYSDTTRAGKILALCALYCMRDYERAVSYGDLWSHVVVCVELTHVYTGRNYSARDGVRDCVASLPGVESDSTRDYFASIARDLMAECLAQVGEGF